ncbi:hypothetical protein [Sutterella megalosphaeroides]|uniref:Uncharacterized protein n=1 Tax=Sutterella megalosphaeroides TaxID=2494234 RepID=A0A2Z6ICZ0_9BURK|nr:hypothetical protein [Sutterella megalosphaeroides]BBF23810.1 hypothetical protein SUTMEG_17010 [Sutterella megalosphaeroides]
MDTVKKTEQEPASPFAELLERVEKLNDEDRFSDCVRELEAVAPEDRDFEVTLALGRAYSNLAVLGDARALEDEDEIDQAAMNRAIELFESIRKEGAGDWRWERRMAYAQWMNPGHEEMGLLHAYRWLALKPDDKDAMQLIREVIEWRAPKHLNRRSPRHLNAVPKG